MLPLFEAAAPGDARPRDALDGIRAFAGGADRSKMLRTVALGAFAAARVVADPAARMAARAAGSAASSAYTHPIASPHQITHILGPAVFAALAREHAAGGDTSHGDRTLAWALRHATPRVRAIAARFPARTNGAGRLGQLFAQLDAGLRGERRARRRRTGSLRARTSRRASP